jgi:hypothetical protein
MKSTARIKANREREVPSWKGYLIIGHFGRNS